MAIHDSDCLFSLRDHLLCQTRDWLDPSMAGILETVCCSGPRVTRGCCRGMPVSNNINTSNLGEDFVGDAFSPRAPWAMGMAWRSTILTVCSPFETTYCAKPVIGWIPQWQAF